ncbi:MAG: helix-turn-helix domain-containing protein [Planctomycetota bacterium]|nr:helix-turn-helix domain-containing protein [Planctomycetota bacterium]
MNQNQTSRRATLDAAVSQARCELPEPAYLDTPAAAAYLSVSRKQLEHWRSSGCGPVYSRLGRHVRYSRVDLDAWMSARRISNTAQEASAR